METEDEKPAIGVPVVVDGPMGKSVIFTDEKGQWTIYDVEAGEYVAKTIGTEPTETNSEFMNEPMRENAVSFEIKKKSWFEKFSGLNAFKIEEKLISSDK